MDSNKMIINKSTLNDIADAIRTKTDTVDLIPLNSFKQRILNIESNGLVFQDYEKINNDWKFYRITSKPTGNDYDNEINQTALITGNFIDVNLPYDYSIYDEFNNLSASTYGGGYLDGGDAWYKKTLTIDKEDDMRYFLYFEGVYMESDVIVNGTHLNSHKNGYTNFIVEISNNIVNGDNEILVFTKNRQPNSRWYSGSGIYRDVYLLKSGKVGFTQQSVKITTPNLETEYKQGYCTTHISYSIDNTTNENKTVNIEKVIKYFGDVILKKNESITVNANTTENKETDLIVAEPKLWEIFDGQYYTLEMIMTDENGKVISKTTTYYGYRWFNLNPNTGFWLNGKHIKLRGACMHHDLGILGSEINQSAVDRQIRTLKEAGFNAIRLTHNPSSSEYTNACMKYGIMCIEEAFDCWTIKKKNYDYARFFLEYAESDIKAMVKRSRNNPCIIAWSLGNEIYDTRSTMAERVLQDPIVTVQNLIRWVNEVDGTRPCTMGENGIGDSTAQAVSNYLGMQGINYSPYSTMHKKYPDWCIYGSERTSAISSRGVYARDDVNYQCSSYDDDKVSWGSYAYKEIDLSEKTEYCGGMFIWTGFDYIGEPTPFNKFPTRSSYFGCVDIAGLPKDSYYLYKSMWTDKPMCHIVPMNWSQWNVDDNVLIMVYANASSVKLYLNGTLKATLTNKNIGDSTSKGSFYTTLPFEKGRLVANAYDANNNLIAQDVLYTPYAPKRITMKSDKKYFSGDDLLFIEMDVCDKDYHLCPNASYNLTVTCHGGTVIGVDNGDSTSVLKYKSNSKPSFNGKAVAVIKPNSDSNYVKVFSKCTDDINIYDGDITINRGDMTVYNIEIPTFIDATEPYEYIEEMIPCTDLSVSPNTVELNSSTRTQQLTVITTPTDTTDIVTFESNDNDVAVVSPQGIITAINDGSCTITVSCGNQTVICNVVVSGISIDCTSLVLSDTEVTLKDKSQHDITATVLPSDCTYEVQWASSNNEVFVIDNGGHYTAVADGNAEIIATCGSQTARCSVNVDISGSGFEYLTSTSNTIGLSDPNLIKNGVGTFYAHIYKVRLGYEYTVTIPNKANLYIATTSDDYNKLFTPQGSITYISKSGTNYIDSTTLLADAMYLVVLCKVQSSDITISESSEPIPIEKRLIGITATKLNTVYNIGDEYTSDDITVIAHYSDGSSNNVTNYTINPQTISTEFASMTNVTVTYTENNVTVSDVLTITVKEPFTWDIEWNGEEHFPFVDEFEVSDALSLVLNESTGKYEMTTSVNKSEASIIFDDRVFGGGSIIEVEYETSNVKGGNGWNFGIELIGGRTSTVSYRHALYTALSNSVYYQKNANVVGDNTVNTNIKLKLALIANSPSSVNANVYYNDELVIENGTHVGVTGTLYSKIYTNSPYYKIKAIRVKYKDGN